MKYQHIRLGAMGIEGMEELEIMPGKNKTQPFKTCVREKRDNQSTDSGSRLPGFKSLLVV